MTNLFISCKRSPLLSPLTFSVKLYREALLDPFLHNRRPLTLLHKHLCKEPREQSQLGILFPSKALLCVQWPAPAFGHFRMKVNELINISCDCTLGTFVHQWLAAVSKARGIKYECDEWSLLDSFLNVTCFRLCLKLAFSLSLEFL